MTGQLHSQVILHPCTTLKMLITHAQQKSLHKPASLILLFACCVVGIRKYLLGTTLCVLLCMRCILCIATQMVFASAADVVTDSAAPPLEVPPPVQPHRKAPEQAYYKPPVDRNTVVPPRGADVSSIIHASQQPLPRSDSDNMCAPDASHGTANAARGMPFVQQQQNKHQMPASHAQKAGRAPAQQAQQRQNAGHGSGQAATAREDTFPRVEQRAAPAAEAASARWTCPTCTYRHEGRQAGFLACAVCGSVRKET